jgi:hypothetical protein
VGDDETCRRPASHPFYRRLNQLLREHGFNDFVEAQCSGVYASWWAAPACPWDLFRLLLIGYFEGIDSERGIYGLRPQQCPVTRAPPPSGHPSGRTNRRANSSSSAFGCVRRRPNTPGSTIFQSPSPDDARC